MKRTPRARPAPSARRLVLLLAAAVAAACGDDPVQPLPELPGSYLLDRVDVGPPPAIVKASENCDLILSSGSLEILSSALDPGGDPGFFLDLNGEQDCSRGGGGTTGVLSSLFGFVSADGATLSFYSRIPGDTVVLFGGTRSTAELTIVLPDTGFWGLHTLGFARTGAAAGRSAPGRVRDP